MAPNKKGTPWWFCLKRPPNAVLLPKCVPLRPELQGTIDTWHQRIKGGLNYVLLAKAVPILGFRLENLVSVCKRCLCLRPERNEKGNQR